MVNSEGVPQQTHAWRFVERLRRSSDDGRSVPGCARRARDPGLCSATPSALKTGQKKGQRSPPSNALGAGEGLCGNKKKTPRVRKTSPFLFFLPRLYGQLFGVPPLLPVPRR